MINPIHEILLELWWKPSVSTGWSVEHCEHTLSTLLKEGMDPNIVFHERGFYPLWFVHHSGMTLSMVEQLIQYGADVNFESGHCFSPIHRLNGRFLDKAELLFQAGAHLHQLNRQKETVLHSAMREVDKPWIEWLILHGADIHSVNSSGQTPLDVIGQSQRIVIPEHANPIQDPESIRKFAIQIYRDYLDTKLPSSEQKPNIFRL